MGSVLSMMKTVCRLPPSRRTIPAHIARGSHERRPTRAGAYAQFGTSSPCWRLSNDSNALELTPVTGDVPAQRRHSARSPTSLANPLPHRRHLAPRPRRAACSANRCVCISSVKRSPAIAGPAPRPLMTTPNPSRAIWFNSLAFAEQVVSEVNSVVVIVDRHGRIQRFNRLAEELMGVKEEDIIGRNVWALSCPPKPAPPPARTSPGFSIAACRMKSSGA